MPATRNIDAETKAKHEAASAMLAALEGALTALAYHIGGNLSPPTARAAAREARAALAAARAAGIK